MTHHLTDDVLSVMPVDGPADDRDRRHLAACQDCRSRQALWHRVGTVLRAGAAEHDIAPPSFDALLGPLLGAAAPERGPRTHPTESANPARRPPLARPWRTAWQLVVRQAVLMPRLWAPASAVALVAAAAAAAVQPGGGPGTRLYTAVVVLLVLAGALAAGSPRRDPRHELLHTTPVSPTSVLLARLTAVLGIDLALAASSSLLVSGSGWWTVVTGWLGQSLLAGSLALALSVRSGPVAGAVAGGGFWLLGVLTGPEGLITSPITRVLAPLLSTTVWALLAAAALLAWGVTAMRRHTDPPPAT
ncbi:hypothetical protein PUR71_26440 [Streptomyces sp. SP17BM10]|uniref:hypothetical protein n=1 Tax=Streptomyces sp. SP17BM10 TaxID=3002530 RepID=UPI002E7A34A2|nr:hypothetical protein [Streptomyces sp. SP17BM10]MEE1786415.1 hypothetical protein [Streptomyces sp. SP17BM10]